jgi:LPXTG-motif cell wall-anchored protein
MDATTTVRVIAGVIFVILLFILIYRRRNKMR